MVRKLLVFTSGGMMNPASRIRGYYMAKYLSENGFDVKVFLYENAGGNTVEKVLHLIREFFNRIRIVIQSSKETLIYIQRGICPVPKLSLIFFIFSKFISRRRVIYDIDDGLFLTEPFATDSLIKLSDAVIAGGHELLNYVRKHNDNVFLMPTSADLKEYLMHRPLHKGEVRLGFIGSPTTTTYMKLLLEPLGELAKNHDFELRIISAPSYAEYRPFNSLFKDLEKRSVKLKLIPWNLQDEFHELQDMDIGLAPLFDGEWEEYKCGFKTINYMAAGLPTAASNVGENRYIIQDGVNGLLCRNSQEWTEKLAKLVENEELRRDLGINARKTVEREYCMEENAKILAKILTELHTLGAPSFENFLVDRT